jgi:glycine cleavage system aminomethyltransferase T
MHAFTTESEAEHKSPLEAVLMRHGGTMTTRNRRSVAAHFGSATSEAAVCLSTVGIVDRFDRSTLELRGAPEDVELAIGKLSTIRAITWWSRTTTRGVIIRCEHADTKKCLDALIPSEGTVAVDLSDRYAAVGVIGPSAEELLAACNFDAQRTPPIVLREADAAFEVLVPAAAGPALWERLLEVGAPLRVACVGLDAVEHLAAAHRLDRSIGSTFH